MEELKIKDLIHSVRNELIESEIERKNKGLAPLFYVDNFKIEVNFVVEKNLHGGGKLNPKIIDVGGDAGYKTEQIHKITLELKTLNQHKDEVNNPDNTKVNFESNKINYPKRINPR